MVTTRRLVESYGGWMADLVAEGFEPFFLSFMFRHIPGSAVSVRREMERAVQGVYSRSLTRLFRHPNSVANRDLQPRWVVCPDYPVGKGGARDSLRTVTVNDGRHMQGIAMVFPENRLGERFDLHLMSHERTYLRPPLLRLHAEPIRTNLLGTNDYALKQLPRGRVSHDELLILPRTRIEMAGERASRRALRDER